MLELKNKAVSHEVARGEREEFKMKVIAKLERLEEEILRVKGKRREEAVERYRELLWLLREEPIYLVRYE